MLLSNISILLNAAYIFILNISLYTDKVILPSGRKEYHVSPLRKLEMADLGWLFYLQLAVCAISVIASVIAMIKPSNRVFRNIQIIALLVSTVTFLIIMAMSRYIHAKY